jgi:hypothetical protein
MIRQLIKLRHTLTETEAIIRAVCDTKYFKFLSEYYLKYSSSDKQGIFEMKFNNLIF